MKLLAFVSSSAILVAAVAHQEPAPNYPEPLATDYAKLSEAKSLKVHLSSRIVGEVAKDVTLEFSKDKKFKITDDAGSTISDGTTLWTYNKAKNTYTQGPITPNDVAKIVRRVEVFGWAAFMQAKPGADFLSVLVGPNTTVKGKDLQSIKVTLKPDARSATYLIDPATSVTMGVSIMNKGKEYLVLADKVDLGADPLPDTEFAFTPPDGATLVKEAEPGTFADVQNIMNDNCMPCHNADHKRASIDLTNYDGIAATVTPGQSSTSLLISALTGNGATLMPKGGSKIAKDKIDSVAKWIDAGAKKE